MVSTALALVLAILAPFIWGFINIIDKFVLSHRVKGLLGYTSIVGVITIVFGGVLALFLDWSAFSFMDLLFPAIAGVLFGSSYFIYYLLMDKEDASNVIGFLFVYPVLVSFLSFIFLQEVISLAGYVGAAITILGVLLLTTRVQAIKYKAIVWLVPCMILVYAFSEFFVKVATIGLPTMNGVAINLMSAGIILLFALLSVKARKAVFRELKNAKWAFLNQSILFVAMSTLYVTMAALPATIVSSLAAIQPLAVLLMEKALHHAGIRICDDVAFGKKLVPLALIVLGVVIIYSQELLKLFV